MSERQSHRHLSGGGRVRPSLFTYILPLLLVGCTSDSSTGPKSPTEPESPAPVAAIKLSSLSAQLVVGSTYQLKATPEDAEGNALADRPVSWSSSDLTVATVSAAGLVTTKAVGKVAITAKSEGRSSTASITVVEPQPVSLTISFSGVPRDSVGAQFKITDPEGLSWSRTAFQGTPLTTSDLKPGTYRIDAPPLWASTDEVTFMYQPTSATWMRTVFSGQEAKVHFQYELASGAVALSVSGLPSGVNHQCRTFYPGGSASFYMTSTFGLVASSIGGRTEVRCLETLVDGVLYDPSPATQAVTVPFSTTPVPVKVTYSKRD